MAGKMTCPQGHRWDNPADAETCPVCGATAQAQGPDDWTQTPDELPPLPPDTLRLAVPPAPTAVAGYEILAELGRGGMGVVYKARQLSLKRDVALKMILYGVHAGPEALHRLRAEAEIIARLKHPNIVNIYDVVEHQGLPCFSMEYVEGGSLDRRLAGQPLPPREAAGLTRTLALAVEAAHERGIVHRDLKPANILLDRDGTPKVTDFGLAKRLDQEGGLTRSGHVMGTPHYMAPEQVEGKSKRIGPATDVYALGALLYEMLTGRPPFRGESASGILVKVLSEEPAPPRGLQAGIPPHLEAICLKCLAKDPARRYTTARALAEDLGRFLTAPPTATEQIRPPPARPAGAWLGFIAAALGLLLIASLAFVPSVRDRFFPPAKGPNGGNGTNGGDLSRPDWAVLPGPAADKEEPFDRIAFPTRDVGYLASRKAVYRTRDGAKTWGKLKLADIGRVHLLHFTDTQTGWLGTDRLRKTADGGETWVDESLGGVTMRSVTSLALHPDGGAVAGGTTADGKLALFRRGSAGDGWVALDPAGGLEPYERWSVAALAVTAAKSGLAVLVDGSEGGGVVLRTADGGRSWQKSPPFSEDLYRLSVDRHGRGWLSGFRGSLWHTGDRGENWIRHENPDADQATPTALAFDPDGKLGLAPLWNGKVLMKKGSEPWTVHAVPLGYALPHAAVVDPGCAYVLGVDGAVARLLGAPAASGR